MTDPPKTTPISPAIAVLVVVAVVVAAVATIRVGTRHDENSNIAKALRYDVAPILRIDPRLLRYKPAAEIPLDFNDVSAIATGPDDSIYVGGDTRIVHFSRAGVRGNTMKLDGHPECLAVGADGTIYAGFARHIEVLGKDGSRKASWPDLGRKTMLTSIAVASGDVFAADAGNRVVLRFGHDGKIVRRIGARDPARDIPGFVIPSPHLDIAIGADGMLWATNTGRHRVEAYTFDGDFELAWGKASMRIDGFGGCCNPVHLAALKSGGFVTCEKGLYRIKVYSAAGEFEGVVAGPQQLGLSGEPPPANDMARCSAGAFDLATDSTGRVLVLDCQQKYIRIFAPLHSRQG